MRKHLFGFLALVLAIGLTAFKSYRTSYYFKYFGSDFRESNVEDRTKWIYTNSPPCHVDFSQLACTLKFNAAQTELVEPGNPIPALKVSGPNQATIVASQLFTLIDQFYVSGGNAIEKYNTFFP